MGLSYNPKPAFIETLIEAGSAHFLSGAAELFAFAAEFEASGGEGAADSNHISKAVWQFSRALDRYNSLLSSLEGIPVAPQTDQMLRDLLGRQNLAVRITSAVIGTTQQLDQVLASARGGDPKGPIRIFAERLRNVLGNAEQVRASVEAKNCSVGTVQAALSSMIDCYLVGHYIAEFNRLARSEFAPAR